MIKVTFRHFDLTEAIVCLFIYLFIYSHVEFAHEVKAGKDIVNVYTLDPRLMGTERWASRSFLETVDPLFWFQG